MHKTILRTSLIAMLGVAVCDNDFMNVMASSGGANGTYHMNEYPIMGISTASVGNLEEVKRIQEECASNGDDISRVYSEIMQRQVCEMMRGQVDVVEYLLDTCNVDVEAKDRFGNTALMKASEAGQLDTVKYFYDTCNVDVEAKIEIPRG